MKSKKGWIALVVVLILGWLIIFNPFGGDEEPIEPIEKEEVVEEKAPEPKKVEEKKPEPPKKPSIPETYVVKDGETLVMIADRFYGDSEMWYDIFSKNESEIDNPNKLIPGTVLRMPQPGEERGMPEFVYSF